MNADKHLTLPSARADAAGLCQQLGVLVERGRVAPAD
jgi:hypothetical protein